MVEHPDRRTEGTARDPGEEGMPPADAVPGTGQDQLSEEERTWAAAGRPARPEETPRADRAPRADHARPETSRKSDVSPGERRGFAVTAWVWLPAAALVALLVWAVLQGTD